MKGDRFLFAGAAAIPSLGGGMVAYQHGLENIALAAGLPGALFLLASFLIGSAILLNIAGRRIAGGLYNVYRGVHG